MTSAAPATGHRAMPVLAVTDVAASVAFYRDKLGFEVGGIWPSEEEPCFAIVGLGRITIALDLDKTTRPPRGGWAAYLYIDGVDAYHQALVERGVEIVQAPHDTFYGLREISIRDIDGHMLAFGQDLQPGEQGPGL